MPAPSWLAGQRVKASQLQLLSDAVPRIIRKTADQSKANTTLVNDAELLAAVEANTAYDVLVKLIYAAGTTGDLKVGFTWPSLATFPWGLIGNTSAMVFQAVSFSLPASGTTFALGGNTTANDLFVFIGGTLTVGANAGNLRLQFAQNASDAGNNTTIKAGSSMTITKA
jgi:hypothetical protein